MNLQKKKFYFEIKEIKQLFKPMFKTLKSLLIIFPTSLSFYLLFNYIKIKKISRHKIDCQFSY